MKEKTTSALDLAFSGFMADRAGLGAGEKELFSSAICSLTAALRDGHTCIAVDRETRGVLSSCRLVSDNGDLPLVLCGRRLYLSRYFRYESHLALELSGLAQVSYHVPGMDGLLDLCFVVPKDGVDWQREAARVALSKGLCIITGGPGTGKTSTVVKIAGLLLAQYGTGLRIALAAPTGKAAMRMSESVVRQVPLLPLEDDIKNTVPTDAHTLHRLLGVRRYSQKFRHDRERPMTWDVVIVDEASMVDLALMSKLVGALKQGARLILLGDRDQLASVESGAVLSDCINSLRNNVVELQTAWRFNQAISAFADRVNRGDADSAWNMLETNVSASIAGAGENWLEQAGRKYAHYLSKARQTKMFEDFPALFALFGEYRVLCAVKNGLRGVRGINFQVERYLALCGFECGKQEWYHGRPVIVTRNDYGLGLYNGDIGICLPDPENNGELAVWFEQEEGNYRRCLPIRLPACETVYGMTIHKSQGSEFSEILVILPRDDNQVLCRELLYTAITRARNRVSLLAEEGVFMAAVTRRIRRHSGLAERLTDLHEIKVQEET